MEDIRIGSRIHFRWTPVAVGTPVTLSGDARRVGIRIIANTTQTTANNNCTAYFINGASTLPVMRCSAGHPIDEMWLEKHGNIVYSAFIIEAGVVPCAVIEFFLDDQQNGPQPGKFPTRDIRGPIPTAIP